MINFFPIFIGKLISFISKAFNLGNGSTWPGHIALTLNKNFIKNLLKKNPELKIILVAGTNGKTTTVKLIETILEKSGKKIFRNLSGANLLNGIASCLLLQSNIFSKIPSDFAIFEIDENSLPLALKELIPQYVVVLNLFRDQLDRYGEVNSISKKWSHAIESLPETTTLILNADDPQIAFLGKNKKNVLYFGLNDKKLSQKKEEHAADSTYCPHCDHKLEYKLRFFSHLGIWRCAKCKNERPKLSLSSFPTYPLPGVYNKYNTLAAVLLAKTSNINNITIEQSLKKFEPAFGRQEKLTVAGKHVQLFLSKNPTSFNQSLRTVAELKANHLLVVLNDRIPDGRDVSWIWDVDFEEYLDSKMKIHVSGDRCYDMALRLKYAHPFVDHVDTHERLDYSIRDSLKELPKNETLYILPTYSAMLEVRKILTGKKIL